MSLANLALYVKCCSKYHWVIFIDEVLSVWSRNDIVLTFDINNCHLMDYYEHCSLCQLLSFWQSISKLLCSWDHASKLV